MSNENTNCRRNYSPEEKVKILRQYLLEGVPISEVCEKEGINPTRFYQWQKTFFENGAAGSPSSPTPFL
jgi:transposase-like protein